MIPDAPIREEQLRVEGRRLFGRCHHADGSITINIDLLRVWRATVQLLHALDDDGIDAINARLVAAIRKSPPHRPARAA